MLFRSHSGAHSISIHAPRTGSDKAGDGINISETISIHAPRTGSDSSLLFVIPSPSYFNPRSPYGERLRRSGGLEAGSPFQSTLPVRGATCSQPLMSPPLRFQSTLPVRGATTETGGNLRLLSISIHAPRTGSDVETCSFLLII